MAVQKSLSAMERLLWTLGIVYREGKHLQISQQRLFSHAITVQWVNALEHKIEDGEQLEAFVSRFGRMQDTVADKLLPRWLVALEERTGSQIEILNRAEQLGVLESTEVWLEARKLRNRLIHEYMTDPVSFAEDLNLANRFTTMLLATYQRLRADIIVRLGVVPEKLPAELSLLS
ncbi:MAG: hypothetical protein WC100_04725 [Sterolibacterium sp.]